MCLCDLMLKMATLAALVDFMRVSIHGDVIISVWHQLEQEWAEQHRRSRCPKACYLLSYTQYVNYSKTCKCTYGCLICN